MIRKISYFFVIFSLLLFTYTSYRSEIIWEGNLREYYLNYFIFSFTLIIISITFLFFKTNILKMIFIYLGSFLFSLYLFEGYSYFIDKSKLSEIAKIYEIKTGKIYETRSASEFIEYEKKFNNKNFVQNISPLNYKNIYSLGGISNENTVLCNEDGYMAKYKSDRYGFNNLDKIWDKDKIKYFLVGDSFVHGHCVNRPNDIASVLMKLSKETALNLGYGGNGPLIEYATLREYLIPNVENILWFFYDDNDLINLKKEFSNELLKNYLFDENFTQSLTTKQIQIDLNLKTIINKKENNFKKFIKLFETRQLIKKIILSNNKSNIKLNDFENFKNILIKSKKIANYNNSNFYFVYLPSFSEFYDERYRHQYKYENIKRIVQSLNINFIDTKNQFFNKIEDPKSLYPNRTENHFNILGYRKVTKFVFDEINKK
tara:strand:+ start:122 stop:1411 length:1290 start_codon:yes stop_codon:yes gene_type:complete